MAQGPPLGTKAEGDARLLPYHPDGGFLRTVIVRSLMLR